MFVSTFQLDSGVIMPELWTAAATEIKERIGKQNYETWIKPISFVSRNKNEILLEVPNKFFREWLTDVEPSPESFGVYGLAKKRGGTASTSR